MQHLSVVSHSSLSTDKHQLNIRAHSSTNWPEGVLSSAISHFLNPNCVKDQFCLLPKRPVGVVKLLGQLIQYHYATTQRLRRDAPRTRNTPFHLLEQVSSSSYFAGWKYRCCLCRTITCLYSVSKHGRLCEEKPSNFQRKKKSKSKHPITKYQERLMKKQTN